ncbi:MAG: transposase [Deltaproteobacteria bacterium RIFCSPLOWO2_12_FULL_60_19]|nr:MAG: transposase [Deltaproteobacteria bacterium RIFCSPLOWO2_12_FULL_60_19]
MKYDPEKHHRRSIRIRGYDYLQGGMYFVTICTRDRESLFGEVVDGGMRLNPCGEIARICWAEIPEHFPHAVLDLFVVMPNHIHGIVVVGARHAVPLQSSPECFGKPIAGSIPTVVRSFKSAVAKRVNALRGTPGIPVWQRNYYEHVVRDEESLNRIRQYVADNPTRWAFDRENPRATNPETVEPWRV